MVRLKGLQIAINCKGLSQASLAEKMGVSQPAIQLWATKECKSIPADRIKQMSEILGVSIDFIYNGKEYEKQA